MNRGSVAWMLAAAALAACLVPAVACGSPEDEGVTVSVSVTAVGGVSSTAGGGSAESTAGTSGGTTGSTTATTGPIAVHELTIGTTEGPYYVTGTSELVEGNLNYTGLPGERIKITGHVYAGNDTSKPVAAAKVEIWHADSEGIYHPDGNGDAERYSPAELALRGYVLTDLNGRYEFTSIYPGFYRGRTRHIHVRASVLGYGAVTTQIIVPAKPGDGVTPDQDMIARSLPRANFVTFTDEGGVQTGTFDFFIAHD